MFKTKRSTLIYGLVEGLVFLAVFIFIMIYNSYNLSDIYISTILLITVLHALAQILGCLIALYKDMEEPEKLILLKNFYWRMSFTRPEFRYFSLVLMLLIPISLIVYTKLKR